MSDEGKKFDSGKAPISLIPAEFIEGIAQVFAFGAKKYGAHNFRAGFDHSRALDALMRHGLAIMRGEEFDPESGLPHIYHLGCSAAMLDYMRIHHPAKNDLYEVINEQKRQQFEIERRNKARIAGFQPSTISKYDAYPVDIGVGCVARISSATGNGSGNDGAGG